MQILSVECGRLWFLYLCASDFYSVCYKQVLYNWTVPLHTKRSNQILTTRTFVMFKR